MFPKKIILLLFVVLFSFFISFLSQRIFPFRASVLQLHLAAISAIENEAMTKLQSCPKPQSIYPELAFAKPNKSQGLDTDYIPPDLIKISQNAQNGKIICLRQEPVLFLEKMLEDAQKENIELKITSGWRSAETQKLLYDYWLSIEAEAALDMVALPGHSEHQLGTTIDLTAASINYAPVSLKFGNTKENKWLEKNAKNYGFVLSYPKHKEKITGYNYEPWHYRFVGKELASQIANAQSTYTEYAANTAQKPKIKTNANSLNLSSISFLSVFVSAVPTTNTNKAGSDEVKILIEQNPEEKLPIASITKLMTAIIALDNCDLEKQLTITKKTVPLKNPWGKLKLGETFQVSSLLFPLLIESNNDAAQALASVLNKDEFVNLMNQKALSLGLQNTYYANPTGLDPAQKTQNPNYSSAKDLLNLAIEIIKNYPIILNITSLKEVDLYTAQGKFHHTVKNTNKLLDYVDWQIPIIKNQANLLSAAGPKEEVFQKIKIVGTKTGETDLAKQNLLLITEAPVQNSYIINIVLSSLNHFEDMKKLVEWTYKNYEW